VITKWLLKYIQFARSMIHRWFRNACWNAGSKNAPSDCSRWMTCIPFAIAAAGWESAIPRAIW
jgi:hypothetical protein